MAVDQRELIYTLGVTPGIKRDGTTFESREFSDGEWCRFQRGVPKKIGGYRQMFREPNGIPRGMIMNAYNGVNYIFVGTNNTLDVFTTGTTLGLGSGPYTAATTGFTADNRNLWQFDMLYSPLGDALNVLAHPGLNLAHIDNAIKTQVLYGNLLPSAGNTWTFTGLADTGGQNPTGNPIEVDGGVCVLYPFVFVYGSNGYIANNNVDVTDYANQTPDDWNGPLANQVNMTAGKVVKGMPVRGGTNSPSGLFWATDSLIRVSFTGNATLPWRYDILSSQTSIMSSSSVVEMDGVYFWMGVDRFYAYNGSVQVLPNDKNVNWLFDNLNYEQRQKVWATKIPRYNEIWFFYPRGTATECTDAIIYNVKDKLWYDAGEAVGARRSCGYTTEVFPSPVWCGWDYASSYGDTSNVIEQITDTAVAVFDAGIIDNTMTVSSVTSGTIEVGMVLTDGSILPGTTIRALGSGTGGAGTYIVDFPQTVSATNITGTIEFAAPGANGFYLAGDQTSAFSPGDRFTFQLDNAGPVYTVATSQFFFNVLSAPYGGVTFITATDNFSEAVVVGEPVYSLINGYSVWQQEFGLNRIDELGETAIPASFTTCDISWIGGDPAQDTASGINRRMHLTRVEPDFIQGGDMTLNILGRPFARGTVENNGPFTFGPETGKIDLRVEHREVRLQFTSNTLNGNFEMGRIMITAELGDQRP